jgi:hypothetical protein
MVKNHKTEIDYILSRMKAVVGADSDVQLGKLLGYKSTSTVSGWRAAGKVPDAAFTKVSRLSGIPISELVGEDTYHYVPRNPKTANYSTGVLQADIISESNVNQSTGTTDVETDKELQEVIALYKQYGNQTMLRAFKEKLLKLKEISEG